MEEEVPRPRRIPVTFVRMEIEEDTEPSCRKLWACCCFPLIKLFRCIKACMPDQPPVQSRRRIRKHINFISSPMGNKSTRALPGIEETVSEELADHGVLYAYQLYHNYMLFNRDRDLFVRWMTSKSRICVIDAYHAYHALAAYEEVMMRNARPDLLSP